jgi:hypothetical protein
MDTVNHKMDNVQIEKMNKATQHMSMFFSILKSDLEKLQKSHSEEDYQQVVKRLRTQHEMNTITLQDLGLTFDKKNQIRTLNDRIRDLESALGQNDAITPASVSAYCENINNKGRKFFEQKGVGVFLYTNMDAHLTIKLKHVRCITEKRDGKSDYDESDQVRDDNIQHAKERELLANEQLDCDEEHILFTDRNMDALTAMCNDYFAHLGTIDDVEVKIHPHGTKDNRQYHIADLKVRIITQQSHLAFRDTMAEFNANR